jgi:nitrous oxidase accessory protein NosD
VVRGNTMSGAGLAQPTAHGYEGTWGNSIYIWNSSGHLVELNKVSGNYWSSLVSGQNTVNGTIRNNNFGDGVATSRAVWIEQVGANHITLDSNQLDGGLSAGDTGGDYLTITNNTIRSRDVGIDVSFAAKNVTIQGNTITSKAGYRLDNGIYLWEKSTPDVNVQVRNNAISGFDKGIAVNNMGGTGTVYGVQLSGNTFSGNNVNVWVPSTIKLNQPLGQ